MRVGLRLLQQESVHWLREALLAGDLSRNGLARGLCLAHGWLNPKQEPCVASAAKALPQLASALGLSLPPPQARPGQGRPRCQAQVPATRCRGWERCACVPSSRPRSGRCGGPCWSSIIPRERPGPPAAA